MLVRGTATGELLLGVKPTDPLAIKERAVRQMRLHDPLQASSVCSVSLGLIQAAAPTAAEAADDVIVQNDARPHGDLGLSHMATTWVLQDLVPVNNHSPNSVSWLHLANKLVSIGMANAPKLLAYASGPYPHSGALQVEVSARKSHDQVAVGETVILLTPPVYPY